MSCVQYIGVVQRGRCDLHLDASLCCLGVRGGIRDERDRNEMGASIARGFTCVYVCVRVYMCTAHLHTHAYGC